MALQRCPSVGVVLTDAGDQVEFRCGFTWNAKDVVHEQRWETPPEQTLAEIKRLTPPPPKHSHKVTILFDRKGPPVDLLWDHED